MSHPQQILSPIFLLLLTGCNVAEKLSNAGEPYELSQIQNPELVEDYRPVTMPMPTAEPQQKKINSLWQNGSRAFFKDQRASRVGDVLTVKIDLKDKAQVKKDFNSKRTLNNSLSVGNLFGYEEYLNKAFPDTVDKNNLARVNNSNNIESTGNERTREDTLKIELAATIIEQLPNGNFVIQGRQDVRMGGELKTVDLKGIIRPEDVLSDNSITYDKVAEARISSVGKGEMSETARVPWGQDVLNRVTPF